MSIYPESSTKYVQPKYVQPTPEQKLQIFTKAREYVMRNTYCRCICLAVREAQNDLRLVDEFGYVLWGTTKQWHDDGGNNMANNFPELYKRKPKNKSLSEAWWTQPKKFPSKRRIAAINSIIAELLQSCKTNEF